METFKYLAYGEVIEKAGWKLSNDLQWLKDQWAFSMIIFDVKNMTQKELDSISKPRFHKILNKYPIIYEEGSLIHEVKDKVFYGVFEQTHVFDGIHMKEHYVEIVAESQEEAERKMYHYFDEVWSQVIDSEIFDDENYPMGRLRRIYINIMYGKT